MRKLIVHTSILLFMGTMLSCSHTPAAKKVVIASVNWAEGIAMTHLSKALLEQQGYKVEVKNADVAPVFAAVARGNADVFLDAWLPVTHKEYLDRFEDKLMVMGTNFQKARIGFVVPEEVNISSIEELNAKSALFKAKIVGIDAGAGVTSKAQQAIKSYGLQLELQSSSEAAMLAVLKKSIDAKQAVVITGWTPHYVFSVYKLKFLDDPKGVFGLAENIQTVVNKKFMASHPELADFFKNFQLDDAELSSLLASLASSPNEQEGVKKWLAAHQDFAAKMVSFFKPADPV